MRLLRAHAAVDALSFKQDNLLHQVTFRDKHAPPMDWDQFILDPLCLLQLWDKFQGLPLSNDDQLSIVAQVRAFLGNDTLPPLKLATPQVDPYRFQSLDRLIVSRKWLPTIQKIGSSLSTGFPSDHYLLQAKN